jgi:hypothetical protein
MYQDVMSAVEYKSLMIDEIDDMIESRLEALREIENEEVKVVKQYNKRVKAKLFQIGDMVWKTILLLGSRDCKYGKWLPSWEGPFMINSLVPGNTCFMESLEGQVLPKALNGK